MHIEKREPTVSKGIRLPASVFEWAAAVAKREKCSVNEVFVAALKQVMAGEAKK
jgi:hypothetical protein